VSAEERDGPSLATVRFGPAVDRWVGPVLVLSGLAMAAATVGVALDPGIGWPVVLLVVAMNVLTGGAVVALTYPLVYEVDMDEVRVRAGLLRYRFALADLARVALVTSLVSSSTAAWTMRRVVLVDRGGRSLEVGPADRDEFVAEVVARAPQLVEDRGAGRGRVWHDPGARRR
jgi:hypothetical protein